MPEFRQNIIVIMEVVVTSAQQVSQTNTNNTLLTSHLRRLVRPQPPIHPELKVSTPSAGPLRQCERHAAASDAADRRKRPHTQCVRLYDRTIQLTVVQDRPHEVLIRLRDRHQRDQNLRPCSPDSRPGLVPALMVSATDVSRPLPKAAANCRSVTSPDRAA